MADGAAATLSQMPPWGWALLLLGSGGAGTLSGLSLESHEQCAPVADLALTESELELAKASVAAANATIQSLIDLLQENKSTGWIE